LEIGTNLLERSFIRIFKRVSNLVIELTDEKSREIEIRILSAFTSSILNSNDSPVFNEVETDLKKLF